jgi:hypothetical protein
MSKDIIPQDDRFPDLISYVESKANQIAPVENCKLCQSKHREEAHRVFENTKNISAVVRHLKDKGEDISHPAVNNHINQHYKPIQERQNIYELAKRLQKWSKISRADESLFNRYIEMLDMEATNLMADVPNLDLSEKRRNLELIIKIGQTIGQFKELMHKNEAEKRPVQIIIESLNRIISVKLEDCKNAEVRQALKEVVDQLTRDVDLANPTAGLKEES